MAPANKDLLRRNAFKGHLTKALNSISAALEQETIDVDHVTALIESVEVKFKKVEDISTGIRMRGRMIT